MLLFYFYQGVADIGKPQLWADNPNNPGLLTYGILVILMIVVGVLVQQMRHSNKMHSQLVSSLKEINNDVTGMSAAVAAMNLAFTKEMVLINERVNDFSAKLDRFGKSVDGVKDENSQFVKSSQDFMCRLMTDVEKELKLLSQQRNSNMEILKMINENIKSIKNE